LYWEVSRSNLPHNNNIQLVYKNDKLSEKKKINEFLLKSIEFFHNEPKDLKIKPRYKKNYENEINMDSVGYDFKKL